MRVLNKHTDSAIPAHQLVAILREKIEKLAVRQMIDWDNVTYGRALLEKVIRWAEGARREHREKSGVTPGLSRAE